jgi:hypothetical protein
LHHSKDGQKSETVKKTAAGRSPCRSPKRLTFDLSHSLISSPYIYIKKSLCSWLYPLSLGRRINSFETSHRSAEKRELVEIECNGQADHVALIFFPFLSRRPGLANSPLYESPIILACTLLLVLFLVASPNRAPKGGYSSNTWRAQLGRSPSKQPDLPRTRPLACGLVLSSPDLLAQPAPLLVLFPLEDLAAHRSPTTDATSR